MRIFKNIYTTLAAMLLLALLVSSCNTNKEMAKLDYDTESLYRDGEGNDGDTITIADTPWQEFFQDDKLKALIQEGLDNNFDLQVANERIQQAAATFKMARAALYPTLAATGQTNSLSLYSDGDQGKKVLGYSNNTMVLGLSTSWEADIWGRLNRTKKARLANFLNSQEYYLLVRTNVVASIASTYYSLIALDEQLNVTKEMIQILEESAETMEALKEAGQQNGAGVEQSRALLYSTQLSIPDLESQIRQQENTLCLLLGRKPGSVERNSIQEQNVPQELKTGIPAQLLSRRPDVKQAELSFRSAFELTRAAHASLYPSLSISSGFLGWTASDFSDFFKPEAIALNLVGGITQPIFNGRQIKSNIEITESQQREAAINFRSTLLSAGQEVSNVLFSFEASLSKNEVRNKQIQSLTNAVDFTRQLLLAGEANYTEVLNSQQSLLSAQLNQINDRLEQLTYCVSLYKALGGGDE